MPILCSLGRLAALLLGMSVVLGGATAQTRITNTATLRFLSGEETRSVRSNTVALDVVREKLPTHISFRLQPQGFELTGLDCIAGSPQVGVAAPVSADQLAAAAPLAVFDTRQPLIMELEDSTSNKDPGVRDTVDLNVVAGSLRQKLRLTETGPKTGVFAGAVPAEDGRRESPCDFELKPGEVIALSIDEDGDSLASSASILVDPTGYLFDSRSGAPVDGARVSLVDAQGQPAAVYGDDGISRYPSEVVSGATVTDAAGRSYPGMSGRYRFPFVAPGSYRLLVEPPASYRAPSTAGPDAIAALRTPEGDAFTINEASYGRSFTVSRDTDFIGDIPLDPAATASVLVAKTASVRDAAPGDVIRYSIRLANRGDGAVERLGVIDTLPPGLRYRSGSTRGAAEPQVTADGRTLTFAAPRLAGGGSAELSYLVSVAPGAPLGEAVNRARAVGPGVTSNEADAAVRLRALLFSDALTIIGRVTEGRCGDPASGRRGMPGIRLLMEDGTFVVTDRDGLYHLEGVRAGRHVVQLDRASVPATHVPVACDRDTRQTGSAISRFVEGGGGLLKRVDFQLAPTGRAAVAADALPIRVLDDAAAAGDRDWLRGRKPGIEWLFPAADHNPRAPVIRVAIQHLPGQRVALTVNGKPTDPLNFDATDTDEAAGVAVSRWSSLPLVPGDNRLAARVLAADGRVAATLERVVHVSGPGVRAELVAPASRLVADGLTRPLIAVRVTDADGRPVRAGTLIPFSVDAPYAAAAETAQEQGRQLAGRDTAATAARVIGDEGLAFLPLRPTTQAGAVHAVVRLADDRQVRTSDVRAWLQAAGKDWVVVGFGAGTLGFDALSRHAQPLPAGAGRNMVADGELSVYAKGRVKGSWLLTIAYGSDRRYDPDRGLLGVIDPDRYYTVYGDETQQGYDAPTGRKLYVRLERREAFALFGDFETGLTEAQLTRYSRTLTGVKAAYGGERVRANGFVAHTDQRFRRDEIQGNGLSGPFRLSARDIVPNSDKIVIEVRDRYRSELILSSTPATRHVDYDIDAGLGTIRFKEPVLSRDPAGNPTFIVVDYEVDGGRDGKLAAAGRVSARLAGGRAELGIGAIHDETVASHATLLGIDGRARLGGATELRGELAGGGPGGIGRGRAWLAEAEHHGPGLDILAYARQQGQAFGVGQQNLVEAGTRKLGLDGHMQLTDRISITGTAWHQEQLVGPGRRIAADLRLEYRRDHGTVFAGAQLADDVGLDGAGHRSRLLTLGGTQALFGSAVEITGQAQLAPGGDAGSADFPVRDQLTAAWRVKPGIRLIGGYEAAHGDSYRAHTARIGFDVAPWRGAKLMSTLNRQASGENAARSYAQYGLSQSLPLGPHWTLDATLDANTTVRGAIPAGAAVNAFQPVGSGGFLASGQGGRDDQDFVAATLGAAFRAGRWSWTGRLERRTASDENRWGLTTSILRVLGEGRTLASSVKAYRITDAKGAVAEDASADLALALRPLDGRWSMLERFQLRHQRADTGFTEANMLGVPAAGGGDAITSRAVNDLAVNYRTGAEGLGHGLEATIYYGAKYVRGRFADDVYRGFIDVTGFELRRDLGRRFDLGVQGSVQHAWTDRAVAFSAGPSASVSPGGQLWVTAGYNVRGYRDRDFEGARYTRAGPYLTLRFKFDQDTIGRATHDLLGRRP